MNESDQYNGPVWQDADTNRRAVVFLRRTAATTVLAIAIAGGVAAFVAAENIERERRNSHLALSATMTSSDENALPALLGASGREGMIISDGIVTHIVDEDADRSAQAERWRDRIALNAEASAQRQLVSTDHLGEEWWHDVLAYRDGRLVVLSSPRSLAMTGTDRILLTIGLLTTAAIALVIIAAAFVHRRFVHPLLLLADAGEDLRVRGEIRKRLSGELNSLGSAPKEIESLSRAMIQIETDVGRGFQEMDALLDAASALGQSLDQEIILGSTLDHLGQLLGAQRSAILRFDAHTKTFDVVAARGHDEAFAAELRNRAHDESLPSLRALRERVPTQVSDTESEVVSPDLRDRARRRGYRSVLAIPLTEALERPTVLVLHSDEQRSFSYDEIELCKSFASIAGAALRNAELFSRTDADRERQTSRLESIVESVDQGILIEDTSGRLLYANAEMRRLLPEGTRVDDLSIAEFAIELLGDPEASIHNDLSLLQPGHEHWVDVDVPFPDNTGGRSYRVRTFVVRNKKGTILGSGQTWSDVSRDRELERMKSGLLAAVSHEFRTPLALIKGYATTLLADDVNWNVADQREFLQLVSAEADRLTFLVQRILDMRRIDARMVSLQLMPVETRLLVDAVLDGVHELRGRIHVGEMPERAITVDAARLVTALRNLVENACKYSPDNTMVDITASIDDNTIDFVIRDRGPGIDESLRNHMFDTFVRGDSALAARQSGLGLGLSIAKGFVEAHGGRIMVEDSPGGERGTVFRVRLDIDPAAEGSRSVREAQP